MTESLNRGPLVDTHSAAICSTAWACPEYRSSIGVKPNWTTLYSLPAGQTWVEYLSTDPEPTCELQVAEENQRESIAVTETAYWTVSEGSSPLYYYARN